MEPLFILLLALVIDLLFGEPPRSLHPVVWMGKVISFLERFAPPRGLTTQLLYGSGIVLLTISIFTFPIYFLLLYLSKVDRVAYIIIGALLLKSTFSFKELRRAALEVELLLTNDNLKEAQIKIRSLVGRETQNLEKSGLVSATVESVAENTCDSFVAPLFYFLLLGLPGAMAYRVVNTLDAMIGYHGKYEYLGKFAAKLDDALNFIPARITGSFIIIAAFFARKNMSSAWQIMLRDHSKTQSPNSGWMMSSMAGALGVKLEMLGGYILGEEKKKLCPRIIKEAVRIMLIVTVIWALICIAVEVCLAITS